MMFQVLTLQVLSVDKITCNKNGEISFHNKCLQTDLGFLDASYRTNLKKLVLIKFYHNPFDVMNY